MAGVAPPLVTTIHDKYASRHAVIEPLIHATFGAIYKPSVKRLYQAGSAMRGCDRTGGDPSRPGHSDLSKEGSSASLPFVSTALQSISIALQTAIAEHIFESAHRTRDASVAVATPVP